MVGMGKKLMILDFRLFLFLFLDGMFGVVGWDEVMIV